MALTTAQIVRSRINDPFRYDAEVFMGDGTASAFKLKQGAPFSTISATATASLATTAGWSATGATIDYAAGRIIFSGVVSANTAIQADYLWSVFSEDEMSYFTATNGDVPSMCLAAVRHLLGNSYKRARWGSPDGSNYDDSQTFQNLIQLRSALVDEIRGEETGPVGDYNSWPEEQQNWF